MQTYDAELGLPPNKISIPALQQFFNSVSGSLGVPDPTRGQVELALEEGVINLLQHREHPGRSAQSVIRSGSGMALTRQCSESVESQLCLPGRMPVTR